MRRTQPQIIQPAFNERNLRVCRPANERLPHAKYLDCLRLCPRRPLGRSAVSGDAVRFGRQSAVHGHAHRWRLRRRLSSGTEWRMPAERRRLRPPLCASLRPSVWPPLLVARRRARLQLSDRQTRGAGLKTGASRPGALFTPRRSIHAAALGLAFNAACHRLRWASSGGITIRADFAKSSATSPVMSATVKRRRR